jgi:nitrous oxidase accessory protein NosD
MRFRLFAFPLVTLALSLFFATSAAGVMQRTFVSANGNDANPCTLTAPCRSFVAAVAQVTPGGEVIALDSAGYGPFSIGKSVTVQAPAGIYAAITATSGSGITINASDTDVITLRGLTINGLGGSIGIDFQSGASLTVTDCTVSGFSQVGLNFGPVTKGTVGIVERSLFANDSTGISISPTGNLAVRNSIATGNASSGIAIFGINSYGGATLSVVDSLLNGNGTGLNSQTNGGGPSHVRLSGNHITNNTTGVTIGGYSDAVSIGNNMARGNGTEKNGNSITVLSGD